MSPYVSVIIPCYNGAQYLQDAVQSVLLQTYDDIECVIVDDGSTDNTAEVCRHLMNKDKRLKYQYKQHGGVASARNLAINAAQGEWIQFLDADDWLNHDKIRFQLDYAKESVHLDEVVFYSDYEEVRQDRNQKISKRIPQINANLNTRELLERVVTWQYKCDCPAPLWSLLIKRTVFNNKMFNEDLLGFSDMEFLIDIQIKNIPFIYTPIIGIYYRQHEDQLTQKKFHKDYYINLLEVIYKKDKSLLELNPNITKLIRHAFDEKDKAKFNRLIRINQIPIHFNNGKIKTKNIFLLKLFFLLKFMIAKLT